MIVPAMTFEQIKKEIVKELPILQRKAEYVAHKLQRTYTKKLKEQDMVFQFDYHSKFYNTWIYQIELGKNKAVYSFLVYYTGAQGLNALGLLDTGEMIYCTGHFFKRYRERLSLELVTPNEVMRSFIKENKQQNFTFLQEVKPGIVKIFNTLRQGTALGVYVKSLRLYKLNTFITFDMLRGRQKQLNDSAQSRLNLHERGLLKIPKPLPFIKPF